MHVPTSIMLTYMHVGSCGTLLVENVYGHLPRMLFKRLPILVITAIIWYCTCSVQSTRLMSAS